MSKIAIMQPYLFPYIGYWQLVNAVDFFVLLDDVNYINKGFINRNYLLLKNQKFKFTLELKGVSQNKIIKNINIGCNSEKIRKTIFHAYKKSPNFNKVYNLVNETLKYSDNSNLADTLFNSIEQIINYLGIRTKLLRSSNIEINENLRGQEKIIRICKSLNCSYYFNNFSGSKLYDPFTFSKYGIKLEFLKAKVMRYKQFNNDFIPNLSIIDVLMFNNLEKIEQMLLNYEISKKK